MNKGNIPVHRLNQSDFVLFAIEKADERIFHGLHRHDFFEIMWFTKTAPDKFVEIDFITYTIGDNYLCLLTPGQVFSMPITTQSGYLVSA